MRASLLGLLLLPLGLAGCTAPEQLSPTAIAPSAAIFNVPELVGPARIGSVTRYDVPNHNQVIERFELVNATINIEHVFVNATFNPQSQQQFMDRTQVEAWALSGLEQGARITQATPIRHAEATGQGWLLVVSLRDGQVICEALRAAYGLRARSDGMGGIVIDTLVGGVACHTPGPSPVNLEQVARQLRLRAG